MKTKAFFCLLLVMLFAIPGYCDWTGKLKEVAKNHDGTGLDVVVEVTDGSYTETLSRPMFRPTTVADVTKTTKNLIAEVKARKAAVDAVNVLYPEAQKEINKPVPEAVAEP